MATSSPATTGAGHASTSLDASSSSQTQSHIDVEMSNLDATTRTTVGAGSQQQSGLLNAVVIPSQTPITSADPTQSKMASDGNENTSPEQTSNPTISADAPSSTHPEVVASSSEAGPSSSHPPAITRLDSVAIGPAVEAIPLPPAISDAGPVLVITLLLTSGARHPYKIDEKYLTKRNVTVPGVTESGKKDPLSISVYTLKELILREWREEWEAQPSSPSSIRLIFFGKLLDDKTPLKECRFNSESANVVHMTVRPQDIVDEEDASKSKALARERDGGESNAGCRCVIL